MTAVKSFRCCILITAAWFLKVTTTATWNKGQRNLPKDDITLLSYSPREVPSAKWQCVCDLERPPFWRKGHRRGSSILPCKRVTVVSYRFSFVTIALSVTIRPQFAIECLRRSNEQGWITLGQIWRDISGRDMGLSCAKEIVSIFSVVWVQCTSMTDRQLVCLSCARQRNGNIDRNRRNRLSAMSRVA